MNTKFKILIIVFIVLGVVAWYGYQEYNRPNKDLSQSKPAVTINADSLIAAFEKDSAAASQFYIDKIILVTGLIKSIDTSGIISLGVEGSMSTVQCVLDNRSAVNFSTLKEGSSVSIQGKCTGYDSDELLGTDVKMNFCVIKN